MVYCAVSDLAKYGVRAEALRTISTDDQTAAITAASGEMDSYLSARYKLPLISWDLSVTICCVRLATYTLMVTRGFNTMRAGDEQLQNQRDDSIKWLVRLTNGEVNPQVADSRMGEVGHISGGAQVSSNQSRGYSVENSWYGGPFTGRR